MKTTDITIPFIEDEDHLRRDFKLFLKSSDVLMGEELGKLDRKLEQQMNLLIIEKNHLMIKYQKENDTDEMANIAEKMRENNHKMHDVWLNVYKELGIEENKDYSYNPLTGAIHKGAMDYRG